MRYFASKWRALKKIYCLGLGGKQFVCRRLELYFWAAVIFHMYENILSFGWFAFGTGLTCKWGIFSMIEAIFTSVLTQSFEHSPHHSNYTAKTKRWDCRWAATELLLSQLLGISLLCIRIFNVQIINNFKHNVAYCYESTNRETNLIFMQVMHQSKNWQLWDNVKTQRS